MKKNKIKFLAIGSDPEGFLYDRENKPVSSVGLIGGSKWEPRYFEEEGFAVQEDNVSVEFNIPPCSTREELILVMRKAKELVNTVLPKGLELRFIASELFTDKQLDNEQAQLFGCEPDYCCWTAEVNPKPNNKTNLRSCGGHLHVSYEEENMDTSLGLVKFMDLYLGVPSIVLDPDTRRKTLYGKAGAFRFKVYGIEYRSLSNFWVANDELIGWVFDQTQKAIDAFNKYGVRFLEKEDLYLQIVECIDNNNVSLAKELVKKYDLL